MEISGKYQLVRVEEWIEHIIVSLVDYGLSHCCGIACCCLRKEISTIKCHMREPLRNERKIVGAVINKLHIHGICATRNIHSNSVFIYHGEDTLIRRGQADEFLY